MISRAHFEVYCLIRNSISPGIFVDGRVRPDHRAGGYREIVVGCSEVFQLRAIQAIVLCSAAARAMADRMDFIIDRQAVEPTLTIRFR